MEEKKNSNKKRGILMSRFLFYSFFSYIRLIEFKYIQLINTKEINKTFIDS